jgi:hypothetical protein
MTLRILLFLFLVLSPATALGQAYCQLRDPIGALQDFFPDSDHYRSTVREVESSHRDDILQSLPFTIHENELATHTLYTVFNANDGLLGLVHVRSERGRWGLTEIAWGFSPDLRIVGMHFQRSRDGARGYIESESFQVQIRGKNFDELKAMLTPDGLTIREATLVVPPESRELATSVIRSALKTISATQLVWSDALSLADG